ncbi:DUF2927 domain-containing protein [Paroceanicella profunda]|nr:DUF2927 domain-containing protein [Paroceanicella profunda]
MKPALLPLFAALLAVSACERPLETEYREYTNLLASTNRMRTDYDPPDAPVTRDGLIRDFETVALHSEEEAEEDRPKSSPAKPLTRWETPIRLRVFVSEAMEREDFEQSLAWIRETTARLTALSGVPIRVVTSGPLERNTSEGTITLFLADEDGRVQLADGFERRSGKPTRLSRRLRHHPGRVVCYFIPVEDDEDRIERALVLIPTETRDALRHACIQEEITQVMGLYNDADDVRPSMFNDDQEFALLTRHDELLLRMLYDPALKTGMTAEDARPLLPAVADRALAADAAGRDTPLRAPAGDAPTVR